MNISKSSRVSSHLLLFREAKANLGTVTSGRTFNETILKESFLTKVFTYSRNDVNEGFKMPHMLYHTLH